MDLALQRTRDARGLRLRVLLIVDQLQCARDFLLCNEGRGIDGCSFLEFGQRLWQFAFLAQLLPAVHRLGARIKTCVFKGRAVAQVFGLQLVGLAEEIEGRFILLASLGVPSFFVEIFSLVGE